jgi:hypothetical protein
MRIYDLNYDVILKILIFLDLDSIHRIKRVNHLFLKYHKLAFKRLNFVAAMLLDISNLKYSYLNNPDYKTLGFFHHYKKQKLKYFKNFDNKTNLNKNIRNGLLKNYQSSFKTSSLSFR